MEHPRVQAGIKAQQRKSLRILIVIFAVAFGIAEGAYQAGALSGLEQVYTDLWHRLSGMRYTPQHTALVVVDEVSLAKYPDDPLVFWPPLFARAMATLREAGVTVIGIDFLFSITPENWFGKLNLPKVEALQNYDLAFRRELNAGKAVLVGAAVRGEQGHPDSLLLPHTDYLLSLPGMDLVSGIGLANLISDTDGAIRRYEIVPKVNLAKDAASGAPHFAFGALMALRATEQNPAATTWDFSGSPHTANNTYTLSFAGPPGTIPRLPFYRLLEKNALNDPDIKALRGKVVVIGGEYQGINDVHATPYSSGLFGRTGTFMPGPEIQANIVETLLSGQATSPALAWIRWLVFAFFLLATLAITQHLTPWSGGGITIVATACVLAAGYGAFQMFVLFPAAHLQLGLVSGFVMLIGVRLTSEERDKARIRNMFEGYVSDDVVNMLLGSGQRLDLGGQSMRITVLFSDIRNFTTITEKLSAHETVEFLNAYFDRVIEIIRAEGGRIDKFIGDAVMAEFGVPYPFTDHAVRAVRAANAMRLNAEEFKHWMRQRFSDRSIPEFSIGIGLHSGDAVVGNLGSKKRMEFTAIGDTVNVASRLESETKTLNCVIVASAETVREAGSEVRTGQHEMLSVKGRAQPVEVYEVTGLDE